MLDFFSKVAGVLFLAVSLAGCPATSPVGGAAGAPSGLSDFKGDTPAQETSQDADATRATIARPHPGGVTSPGAETGDDTELLVEGTAQPVCRLASGDVQYRVRGSVTRVQEGGNQKMWVCLLEGDSGQYRCVIEKMTLLFWGGQSCRSEDLVVTQGKFDGWISAREISDLSLYRKSIPDIQMKTLPTQPPPQAPADDIFDAQPTSSSIREIAKKISVEASQDTLAVVPDHPICEPSPELAEDKLKRNLLQVLPAMPDLPECADFGRPSDDASGAPRLPIIN